MKTTDLLLHLADLLDCYDAGDPDPTARMLCVGLGLNPEAPWPRIAERVRACADALTMPKTPEGWRIRETLRYHSSVGYLADGPNKEFIRLDVGDDGRAYWEQHGRVPLALYTALLSRAGVPHA